MIVFARDQVSQVREGKITATLLLPSVQVKKERPRHIYRATIKRDEDGKVIGTEIERLDEVIIVHDIEMLMVDSFTHAHAVACGVKRAPDLREAWLAAHPKSPVCQLLRFTYGDPREHPRFLASTRSMRWAPGHPSWRTRERKPRPRGMGLDAGQSDYTENPHIAIDDAEVLSDAEYELIIRLADQRHAAHQARMAQQMAHGTPAERLERIRAAGLFMRSEIADEARRRAR